MQLVNFYFDEYKPKPLSFDLRFAGATIVIILLGLFSLGIAQTQQINGLSERLEKKQAEAKQLNQETQALKEQLSAKRDFQSLEKQINRLNNELKQYQKALSNLNFSDESEMDNFSQILKSLANRKVKAIWLTEINIDNFNLSVKGSTTQKESIPLYVADLRNDETLNREFDELSIVENPENKRVMDFALLNGKKVHE